MTESKLGITPGECKWNEFRDHTLRADGWGVIAEVSMHPNNPNGRATGEAHARLFLDAHNVANRTGLTPSELVDAFLKHADHSDECNKRPPSEPCICGYGEIYAALTYITRDKDQPDAH